MQVINPIVEEEALPFIEMPEDMSVTEINDSTSFEALPMIEMAEDIPVVDITSQTPMEELPFIDMEGEEEVAYKTEAKRLSDNVMNTLGYVGEVVEDVWDIATRTGEIVVGELAKPELAIEGVTDVPRETAQAVVGLAEAGGALATGINAAALSTITGAGLEAGNFINRLADYLEEKIPLGEITFDDGISYIPKAREKVTAAPGDLFLEAFAKGTEIGTYEPRTEAGEAYARILASPFEAISEKAVEIADKRFEGGASPLEATGWRTLIEGTGYLAAMGGPKYLRDGKRYLEKKLQKTTPNVIETGKVVEPTKEPSVIEHKMPEPLEPKTIGVPAPASLPLKRVVSKRSGAENLDPRVLTYEEFYDLSIKEMEGKAWGGLKGKQLRKAKKQHRKTVPAKYSTYKAEAERNITRQYEEALSEVKAEGMMKDDFVSQEGIKLWEQIEAENAGKKLSYEEAMNQYETLRSQRKTIEEEMAWAEKSDLDFEVRTQQRINNSLENTGHKLNIDVHALNRGKFGQAGVVDASVFAEGLLKAGKESREVLEAIINEYGAEYRHLAPVIFAHAKSNLKVEKPVLPKKVPRTKEAVDLKSAEVIFDSIKNDTPITDAFMENVAGGRPITPLRKLAENNPPLEKLLDLLEHPRETLKERTEAVSANIFSDSHKLAGRLIKDVETALEPLRGKWLRLGEETGVLGRKVLNKKTNEQVVSLLNKKEIVGDSPAHTAARDIREVLDTVFAVARDSGLKGIEYLEGHFPRMYNRDVINKKKEAWVEMLRKNGRTDPFIESITSHIMGAEDVFAFLSDSSLRRTLRPGMKAKKPATEFLEFERKLHDIPFEDLQPFLKTDVWEVLTAYTETVAARLAYINRFGADEAGLINRITEAQKYGTKHNSPLTQKNVQAIFDIVDIHNRNWIQIKDPKARKFNTALTTGLQTVLLSGAVFPSLAELGMGVSTFGPKRYIEAIVPTLADKARNVAQSIYSDIGKSNMVRMAEEVMLARDLNAVERAAELNGIEATKASNTFFTITLNKGLMQFTSLLNFRMYNMLLKDVAKQELGETSNWNKVTHEANKRYLMSRGVDIPKLVDWYQTGQKKSHPFYETQYKTGAINVVSDSTMMPRAAITPRVQAIPHLRFMWLANRYLTVLGNTVTGRWFDDIKTSARQVKDKVRDPKASAMFEMAVAGNKGAHAAATVALTTLLGVLGKEMMDHYKYDGEGDPYAPDYDENPSAWLYYHMERGGMHGLASKWVGVATSEQYGRDPVEAISPAFSMANDIAGALYSYVEKEDREPLHKLVSKWGPALLSGKNTILLGAIASAYIKKPEHKEEIVEYLEEQLGEDAPEIEKLKEILRIE